MGKKGLDIHSLVDVPSRRAGCDANINIACSFDCDYSRATSKLILLRTLLPIYIRDRSETLVIVAGEDSNDLVSFRQVECNLSIDSIRLDSTRLAASMCIRYAQNVY